MKIIVEIDGKRHRLVKSRKGGNLCEICSIEMYCTKNIGSPCLDSGDYFKHEKTKEKEINK